MKTWYWNFLFLCISFGSYSQNSVEKTAAEMTLLSLEYKIWGSEDSAEIPELLLQKAFNQKEQAAHFEALKTLNRVQNYAYDETQLSRVTYEKVLNYFALGEYRNAKFELDNFLPTGRSLYEDKGLFFLTLMVHNELGNYRDLDTMWNHYWVHVAQDTVPEKLLNRNTPKIKNPLKARKLSSIFPGLGQAYAGKPGAAVSSIVMTGLSLSYMALSYGTGFPITATFTGITASIRFYLGGRRNALRLVKQKNQSKLEKYSGEVRERLLRHSGHFLSST